MKAVNYIVIVLLTGTGAVTGTAQSAPADEWAVPELEFRIVDDPLLVTKHPEAASFAVQFTVKSAEDLEFDPDPPLADTRRRAPSWRPNTERILGAVGGQLCERQRELMPTSRAILPEPFAKPWLKRSFKADGAHLEFLAATPQDARLLGRAILEDLNRSRRERLENGTAGLKSSQEEIQALRDEIEKTTQRSDALEAAQRNIAERAGYRDADQATRDLNELERVVRLANIDITGIRAKLEAIRQAGKGAAGPDRDAIIFRLQIEQNVELAGALARKAAAEEQAVDARKYVEQAQTLKKDRVALDHAKKNLAIYEEGAERTIALLSSLPPDLRPVEVLDNRVTLRRLDAQSPGSSRPAGEPSGAPGAHE